ncbi:MAG TPA: class I SAM-dependent methyltransferase [Planctomycetota bacterium]|nr:class I SAM-dependent methyltransferase [Planctomycetota bacterium]
MKDVPCPLCGHPRSGSVLPTMGDRLYGTVGRGSISRCPRCGIVFTIVQEAAGAYPDKYGPYTLPGASRSTRGGTRERIRRVFYAGDGTWWERLLLFLPYLVFRVRDGYKMRIKSAYEHAFRRIGRLLDVGCGGASWLLLWSRWQKECVGVEPHDATARAAREKTGLDIRSGDLRSQGFAAETFDIVTFCHVLEHLEDPRAELREARRLLRPGGEILIWVPNYGSMFRRLFGRDWVPYDIPRHLWHFTALRLVTLLSECGLKASEVAMDPNEFALRASVRLWRRSGHGLGAWILAHRCVRMMLGTASMLVRRADVVRVRARKA